MTSDDLRTLADKPTLCGEGMVDHLRAAADHVAALEETLRQLRLALQVPGDADMFPMLEAVHVLRQRVATLERSIERMRQAALLEDWHEFQAAINESRREAQP